VALSEGSLGLGDLPKASSCLVVFQMASQGACRNKSQPMRFPAPAPTSKGQPPHIFLCACFENSKLKRHSGCNGRPFSPQFLEFVLQTMSCWLICSSCCLAKCLHPSLFDRAWHGHHRPPFPTTLSLLPASCCMVCMPTKQPSDTELPHGTVAHQHYTLPHTQQPPLPPLPHLQ